MPKTLEKTVRFDGGETRKDIDQYVSSCKGNGINLHIYHLGWYSQCNSCSYQKNCKERAHSAGEQAEG